MGIPRPVWRILRAFGAALALLSAPCARGGEWHYGNGLACSDCHTMHNSSGGVPMRYDSEALPAPQLLRHATALSLCIHCHDGSSTVAPDVIAPVTYVTDPAGGYFPADWALPSGLAHVLATPDPVTPPGGTDGVVLTCISCHDPHGNPSYRNLRGDPLGSGDPPTDVAASQKKVADGSNPDEVYVPANVTYKAGMSAWCGRCHGAFHGLSAEEEGTASPWLRHPQDRELSSSPHADYAYWASALTGRVPVQSPSDDDIPSADDQVFCLSCHKAHGSANRAALIFADAATLGSTCQQCHFK